MLFQEQGSWTREQRAQWSHCAPGGSWEQGGSQQQASPTPSPGQIQWRVEGQLRRLQAGMCDASCAPGLCGSLSLRHVSPWLERGKNDQNTHTFDFKTVFRLD